MKRLGLISLTVMLAISTFSGTVEGKGKVEDEEVLEATDFSYDDIDRLEKLQEGVIKDLKKKDKQVGKLLLEIDEREEDLDGLRLLIEKNEKEIGKVEKKIKKVKREIEELEESINKRLAIANKRIMTYQERGELKYLDVILGAESFTDFIGRATTVTTLMDADYDIVMGLHEDKLILDEKMKEEQELKDDLLEIKRINEEQEEIVEEQIKKLDKDKKKLEKEIKELNLDSKEIKKLRVKIKGSLGMKMELGEGHLEWPTDGGYISSPMGHRTHPITGEVGKLHKGVDIARTDRSTSPPIYAAEDGTVLVSNSNKGGYGNMVIVDHGDGLQTLYAHMSVLGVEVGDKVRRGQPLGVMGTTGSSTGIHLHFEVHDNGKIQNPLVYLESEKKGNKTKDKTKDKQKIRQKVNNL